MGGDLAIVHMMVVVVEAINDRAQGGARVEQLKEREEIRRRSFNHIFMFI